MPQACPAFSEHHGKINLFRVGHLQLSMYSKTPLKKLNFPFEKFLIGESFLLGEGGLCLCPQLRAVTSVGRFGNEPVPFIDAHCSVQTFFQCQFQ